MPISFYKNSSSSGMSPEALEAVLKRLGGDTSVQLPEQKRKGKLSGYVSWGNPPAGFGSRGSSVSAEDILAEALIKDALSANAEKRRTEAEIAKEGRDAKQAKKSAKLNTRQMMKLRSFEDQLAEAKTLRDLSRLGMAARSLGQDANLPMVYSDAGLGAISEGRFGKGAALGTALSGESKTNAENALAEFVAANKLGAEKSFAKYGGPSLEGQGRAYEIGAKGPFEHYAKRQAMADELKQLEVDKAKRLMPTYGEVTQPTMRFDDDGKATVFRPPGFEEEEYTDKYGMQQKRKVPTSGSIERLFGPQELAAFEAQALAEAAAKEAAKAGQQPVAVAPPKAFVPEGTPPYGFLPVAGKAAYDTAADWLSMISAPSRAYYRDILIPGYKKAYKTLWTGEPSK